MTSADYRDMAREIRDLISLALHPQTVADLRALANNYEKLAQYFEVAARVPDGLPEVRRQAG